MEVKKKSVAPVYGFAIVWVLYCAIFPLYKTWHFIALVCSAVLAYVALSAVFSGKTEYIEIPHEPARTGDENIDALLIEGEKAVSEMRRICAAIDEGALKTKINDIISVTEKIFLNLHEDRDDYRQIKRFADYYLPTTIKLLGTYESVGQSDVQGENLTSMLNRIDTALDTIQDSYVKFFDSLFENQALDIETDIVVLENLLKQEGLLKSDF